MEAMRQSWTDERLDDLAQRMDNGFARVDADLRALNARFDALQRTLLQVGAGLGAGLLTVIAALLGLIATQL
jgi:ribosomal protein RSM22 (predicted rRNA methylase)